MAGFEGTRFSPVGEAVRDWRWGRFAPLYAAGILAGVAVGFGIATWPTDGPTVQDHIAIQPSTNGVVDSAPSFALPEPLIVPAISPATIGLPLEYYESMAPLLEVPVVEPIAPAAPQAAPASAPQASAPAPVSPSLPAPAPAAAADAPAPAAKPNFYVPEVSAGPATAMELQLFSLINDERAKAGLAPYALEAGLTRIARTRSQQLIDQNYFGHRDPYGYSMYVELLAHFGYSSYAWAGENLAMNNWPTGTAADEAIHGLMNSPTHKANILAGDFFRIGIGEVTTADGRHFFTMIFLG